MKNVTLNFVHISDNAFFSKDDKLNIIGVFGKAIVTDFPALQPPFAVSLGISGKKGLHPVNVEIFSPQSEPLISSKGNIEILQDGGGGHFVININGLIFSIPGRYVVRVTLDDGVANEDNYLTVDKQ